MKQAKRFYRGMKIWCTMGLRFYFKEWQIVNAKSVSSPGPIIFIPTHQNAFMDAILVICSTPRNPWSIARASVFKKGFVTTLLTAVQIKPVFRTRDGFSSLKNNDAIMQEWTNMLSEGQDIVIFAEGNHNDPYARGTLQRGFARMALKFQQQYNSPLTIVPVGVHYDHHRQFRSRALVNFGDPIAVNEVFNDALNEREKLDRLCDVTEESLKNLALTIEPDEQYQAKYDFLIKYRKVEKNMEQQFQADRLVLDQYPMPPPTTALKKKTPAFLKVVNPIVWIGWILNIIPYSIINRFIKKKVKDAQFIGSLKYAFGIFLVPLYYLILIITFCLVVPYWPAWIAFSLLLTYSGILVTDLLKR